MSKPTILGLRTSIYKVPDLNKGKEWYSKAFKTTPYFDEDFYVGFNIGGYELGLLPGNNEGYPAVDNVMTYWGVNDIQAEYDHMLKSGATEHEKPTSVGGELMVASVRDPWKNVIGLIYNPEFKTE
ncbi:VOC family protein [Mangrovivirga cuniculi]|uniref:Glyoxalase/bleomycin resistance/extradiol dioxygenase family protein n=1 Tax=Mangrovivirga cuniculi TaxID=2715131 RepID=A0A4D7JI33_9BACT|nr:VOC family protein [Mangrovivirga cuniculi]QCK15659.1 glyoxalase/bleomycin resistance/extradiol dioxygenase family protein [Mangrovivirga cuniculi]